eukprot:scaffold248828_cov19-Tisochrysis_lutea.AAC.4
MQYVGYARNMVQSVRVSVLKQLVQLQLGTCDVREQNAVSKQDRMTSLFSSSFARCSCCVATYGVAAAAAAAVFFKAPLCYCCCLLLLPLLQNHVLRVPSGSATHVRSMLFANKAMATRDQLEQQVWAWMITCCSLICGSRASLLDLLVYGPLWTLNFTKCLVAPLCYKPCLDRVWACCSLLFNTSLHRSAPIRTCKSIPGHPVPLASLCAEALSDGARVGSLLKCLGWKAFEEKLLNRSYTSKPSFGRPSLALACLLSQAAAWIQEELGKEGAVPPGNGPGQLLDTGVLIVVCVHVCVCQWQQRMPEYP